jgi:integrase/recombinase XerD
MQALLDAPDPSTRKGVRDLAMLHLAVCAGLRVSELTGLRLDDTAPQSASIRVRGKGRRERALPLWKTAAAALRAWLAIRGPVASPEPFVNARGEPFSRGCRWTKWSSSATGVAENNLAVQNAAAWNFQFIPNTLCAVD